jgi:hypothetical protein
MERFIAILTVIISVLSLSQTAEAQWQVPRGIPEPAFGIEQTVQSHCANCTLRTQSNLNGLSNIPAGTVIEIAPGSYNGNDLVISGNGTALQPIFVRGGDGGSKPKIMRKTTISGSYIIVENMDFDFNRMDRNLDITGDHITLRHSEVHDFDPGHFSTTVLIYEAADIVIYDSHIHDNGDFTFVGEQDVHGVGIEASQRIWLVDSHLHHNRGDSIQLGHDEGNITHDIYIGRNIMHDDGENRVDIKEASNVVITENTFFNPTNDYAHIVLHDCPENVAALYNNFTGGIGIESGSLEASCNSRTPIKLFMIGNQLNLISAWGTGKIYFICGNFGYVDITNQELGSVISSSNDVSCFNAFKIVYGINLNTMGYLFFDSFD